MDHLTTDDLVLRKARQLVALLLSASVATEADAPPSDATVRDALELGLDLAEGIWEAVAGKPMQQSYPSHRCQCGGEHAAH